jgi:hypothetical protein
MPLLVRVTTATRPREVRDRLSTEGGMVVAGSAQQPMAHIDSEIARWRKVIRPAGLKAELPTPVRERATEDRSFFAFAPR